MPHMLYVDHCLIPALTSLQIWDAIQESGASSVCASVLDTKNPTLTTCAAKVG